MSFELVDTTSAMNGRHRSRMGMVGGIRIEEARPFEPHMFSFQSAQQSNGRFRGAEFGMASETQALISKQRRQDRCFDATAMLMCAGVSLWVLLIFTIGAVYWNVTGTLTAARDQAQPYIMVALNHTMNILQSTDHASTTAGEVVREAHDVTASAVPALQHALNESIMIVDRLERLAAHPVLQISLGNTAGEGLG